MSICIQTIRDNVHAVGFFFFFSLQVLSPGWSSSSRSRCLERLWGGKKASRERERCCCSRRNSWASPLHALQFFSPPTGTSKQDLSGMKIRVAQKCTGLVMPKYASAESQIIPLLLNISPAVPRVKKKKNPKNDPRPSYEIDLAAACFPNVVCKT